MDENYLHFRNEIRNCLLKLDVEYFIRDFKCLFSERNYRLINDSNIENKSEIFLNEFEQLDIPDKFEHLRNSAKEHNKWIYDFLTVDISNPDEVQNLQGRYIVLNNLIDMLYASKNFLWNVDEVFIQSLFNQEIITESNKCFLLKRLKSYGEVQAMFELFNVITARTSEWYGTILYLITRQKTAFAYVICNELNLEDDIDDSEKRDRIYEFAQRFVDKHIARYRMENEPVEEDNSDYGVGDMSWDDAESIASTQMEVDIRSFDNDFDTSWSEEIRPTKLKMKNFQLELAELALSGINTIIYAPTGIGKTIVAIYIAREHLRNNPNGKVAFLVPRRHLVAQQFSAFLKYKDSDDINVIEMRVRGESKIGPLVSYLDQNQVFVMTGGIFLNSLTVEDGNKLSSISEFSLIFFDECHHCMKRSTYNMIMSNYIKEKENYPNKRLPQIVGLTASPRSNNSDDKATMRRSIYEICANLDCLNFSYVNTFVDDLKLEITKPDQEVIKVPRPESNDFEASLIRLMLECEHKLEKMKKEHYFSSNEFRLIPSDKFSRRYAGFVGKLRTLNDVTIEENDGKQKAYAIYRYLNAYYRGLIVLQLFNESCAKQCIDRFLEHDGNTFTCCYDEEFSKAYKAGIVDGTQSENPAIYKIKDLLQKQFQENENSRVLIFVQQVAFTYYMADIIQTTSNIMTETIVGRHSKNDLKGCSVSDTNDILRRFNEGDFKVLVATSVVEEGLDVPDCNMVICYGYVTNEVALIQRLGRARSKNSKYFLVLPPMFAWMENKEINNRRRNETMIKLIDEYNRMDLNTPEMKYWIKLYQQKLFNLGNKDIETDVSNKQSWQFKCKSCQRLICTSEELRVLEISHIICINPDTYKNSIFIPKDAHTYGLAGNYELIGSMQCQCRNHKIGKKVLYLKYPYLQLRIDRCTLYKNNSPRNFFKWKDFRKQYTIPSITEDELQYYKSQVDDFAAEP